ncbi:MAG: amidase family protein [Pseudomonadota bacterium]
MEATIPQLQAVLATNAITSRDLVALYLARIAAYDQQGPALNALSVINEKALADADRLDEERRSGTVRGPLHGIPIIIKDNFNTIGMQTAAGSRVLAGWMPPDDARLLIQLRAAGAIILAKSNMHEFARGISTIGSLFGATRNPYALERNPGGSSGGTAAAIAANFAAVGMGTDTCGSVRIPAAHNGLVGIRGTQGLVSRSGIIPLSHSMDIAGPIGRSVTDVAIVLDVIAGYDPADPQTAACVGHVPDSYTDALKLDGLHGARIGMLRELTVKVPEDEEVAAVIGAAAAELQAAGATVVEVSIPALRALLAYGDGGSSLLITQDFKADLNAYLAARPGAPVRSLAQVLALNQVDARVVQGLLDAEAVESRDSKFYLEQLALRNTMRDAVLVAMAEQQLNALAFPTIRRKANLIGLTQAGSNSALSAGSGLPALSVPCGVTADGVPVGLELLGRAWSEPLLLQYAFAYEQATGHRRAPDSTPPVF